MTPTAPAITALNGTQLAALLQATLRMDPGEAAGPPTPAVALAEATSMFLAGKRVDMGVLATSVGVGRATLYRWFGDREHLVGLVLWELSRQALAWLAEKGPDEAGAGRGGDKQHVLESVDAFMRVTSAFDPLRQFLANEPALALRALLDPDAPLVVALTGWATDRLGEAGYGEDPDGPSAAELAAVLVSVTSTYCWARIIAGGEADVDAAMRAVRVLLRA